VAIRPPEIAAFFGTLDESSLRAAVRRVVYLPLQLLEALPWYRDRKAPFLRHERMDWYALSERTAALMGGSPHEAVRHLERWGRPITGSRLLLVGCGEGREAVAWQRPRRRMLVGQDLIEFTEQWKLLSFARFLVSDVTRLPFRPASFDIVTSRAVFEHVRDFEAAVRELARVLVPSGVLSADFGPLWYTHGGALDGRIGYQHIMVDNETLGTLLEPGSEPYFFWQHDLYSRLRPNEYRRILDRHFEELRWHVTVSEAGLRYAKEHPDVWRELTARYTEAELLTKSIHYIGRLRNNQRP
jgi:SAM-dependent methyltransferase